MKKVSALIFGLFLSVSAFADEVPDELYMKIDDSIGGYLTLTLEPCEIPKVKNPYEFKAKIETKFGTRRACWNTQIITPEMEGKMIPFVQVAEEELLGDPDDTRLYHISSIARYYFKPTK